LYFQLILQAEHEISPTIHYIMCFRYSRLHSPLQGALSIDSIDYRLSQTIGCVFSTGTIGRVDTLSKYPCLCVSTSNSPSGNSGALTATHLWNTNKTVRPIKRHLPAPLKHSATDCMPLAAHSLANQLPMVNTSMEYSMWPVYRLTASVLTHQTHKRSNLR
jgi:hypothetical protein